MSGQPDSSDDLIAELAKLMATNAKGEATAATAPALRVATAADGKPVIRIPGMDMPPLSAAPAEPPRGPTSFSPIRPTPSESQPAAPQAPAPSIRIPGGDIPADQPAPRIQPKVDFGKPPTVAPVAVAPLRPAPSPPRPEIRSFTPRTIEPRPIAPAAAPTQRFEPRIVAETKIPDLPVAKAPPAPAPTPAAPMTMAPPAAASAAPPRPLSEARAPQPQERPADLGGNRPQNGETAPKARDPIADLIAADLDFADLAPAPEKPVARPAAPPPQQQVQQPATKPVLVGPRPVAVAAPQPNTQRPPAPKAPSPLRPSVGFTARQVPPESDTFFVAPVFGSSGKPEAPQSTRSAASAPAANDPMDEIESLIGEAVRVEMGNDRPTAPAAAPTQPQPQPPQARQGKPVVAPIPAQPRRAGIKQHESEAVPQSAEAAILAAAAATGAEVGRIEPAVGNDQPARRKQFKPARAPRSMSGGMRQYLGMAVAGTLLLAAALGLYWVLNMGRSDPSTAPVLTADATPVKEVPPTAPLDSASHSPVLDQIDGVSTPPGQETLAATDDDTDAAAVDSAVTQDTGDTESGLANRKVRTVTVRPDGTIVTSDNAVAGASPLPVERPNVPEVPGAQVQPSDLLNGEPGQPMQAVAANPSVPAAITPTTAAGGNDSIASVIANTTPPPASTDVAAIAPTVTPDPAAATPLPPGATATPSDVVAPTPLPRPTDRASMNGQPSTSVTAEINQPQASLNTALTANGQTIDLLAGGQPKPAAGAATTQTANAAAYVQLSSQRSEGDALASLRNISGRWSNLFEGNQPEVRRADLGAKGVYYRVMLPAGSRSQAIDICTQIKSAGGDCFVP